MANIKRSNSSSRNPVAKEVIAEDSMANVKDKGTLNFGVSVDDGNLTVTFGKKILGPTTWIKDEISKDSILTTVTLKAPNSAVDKSTGTTYDITGCTGDDPWTTNGNNIEYELCVPSAGHQSKSTFTLSANAKGKPTLRLDPIALIKKDGSGDEIA